MPPKICTKVLPCNCLAGSILIRHFSFSRWQPTRTPSPWDGILQAASPGPVCPQRFPVKFRSQRGNSTSDLFNDALDRMPRPRLRHLQMVWPQLLRQSEDCLYLNIFVPQLHHSAHSNEGRQKNPIFFHTKKNRQYFSVKKLGGACWVPMQEIPTVEKNWLVFILRAVVGFISLPFSYPSLFAFSNGSA